MVEESVSRMFEVGARLARGSTSWRGSRKSNVLIWFRGAQERLSAHVGQVDKMVPNSMFAQSRPTAITVYYHRVGFVVALHLCG